MTKYKSKFMICSDVTRWDIDAEWIVRPTYELIKHFTRTVAQAGLKLFWLVADLRPQNVPGSLCNISRAAKNVRSWQVEVEIPLLTVWLYYSGVGAPYLPARWWLGGCFSWFSFLSECDRPAETFKFMLWSPTSVSLWGLICPHTLIPETLMAGSVSEPLCRADHAFSFMLRRSVCRHRSGESVRLQRILGSSQRPVRTVRLHSHHEVWQRWRLRERDPRWAVHQPPLPGTVSYPGFLRMSYERWSVCLRSYRLYMSVFTRGLKHKSQLTYPGCLASCKAERR